MLTGTVMQRRTPGGAGADEACGERERRLLVVASVWAVDA
jgi:hypothetical protein